MLRAENRVLITSSGTVIWLRAQVAVLASRVGSGVGRPLLGHDPLAALTELSAIRNPLYQEVAAFTIDVDALTAPEVVTRILAEGLF